MDDLSSDLRQRVTSVEASLSPVDQEKLQHLERSALLVESKEFLSRAQARSRETTMTPPRTAQAAPPEMPPMPQQGQAPAPAPVAPPVDMNTPMVPPDAAPPADGSGAPADGIGQYVDEQEDAQDGMSGDEMGLAPGPTTASAKYLEIYGHLQPRKTAQNHLHIFDPKTGKNLMLVRLNVGTRKDASKIRQAAIAVLKDVANHGISATAKKWKGAVYKSAGGVVDYGDNVMDPKLVPEKDTQGSNSRGDSNMAGTQPGEGGVKGLVNQGDQLTATEPHATRKTPGLGGKSAQNAPATPEGKPALSGGTQDGRATSMADEVNNATNPGNSTDGNDDTRKQKPSGYTPSSTSLEDAVTTFANESLTAAQRRAQAAPPPPMGGAPAAPMSPSAAGGAPEMPEADAPCGMCGNAPCVCPGAQPEAQMGAPPAPGGMPGMTAALDETESKYQRFYAAKANRDIVAAQRRFVARFVSCMEIATRRAALNLEDNHLKYAMAEALMNDARVSSHEDYVPMDSRTASFVIERGLGHDDTVKFGQDLIRRASYFMKMSDESIGQIKADLDRQHPVSPQLRRAQMPPEGEVLDPNEKCVGCGDKVVFPDHENPGKLRKYRCDLCGPNPVPGSGLELMNPQARMAQGDPAMQPGVMPPVQGQGDPAMQPGVMPPVQGQEEAPPDNPYDDPNHPAFDPREMDEQPEEDPAQQFGLTSQGLPPPPPPAGGMTPQAQRARQAAMNGNFAINPSASGQPSSGQGQPADKRDAVRAALGATKGAKQAGSMGSVFGR